MSAGVSFGEAPFPVRGDIPAAHGRVWGRIASPGSWWTGAERVAIAAEVRNAPKCALCGERRTALSADAVERSHDHGGVLPDVAVDVAHRIATDPARLSRSWFEKTLAAGLSDAEYVEIVGVVVAVVSIDQLCRGLGVALHPLPEPVPGEPSRERPPEAELEGSWVPTIPAARAVGPNADLYGGGRAANVIRAMSLVPDAVRDLKTLSSAHYYPAGEDAKKYRRALDRMQIELIAGRVSALNECFY